jgi:ATP-dependent RNA helicase DOB1
VYSFAGIAQLEQDLLHSTVGQTDGITESMVSEYHYLKEQLARLEREMQAIVSKPIHSLPYLQPGRLVKVATTATTDSPSTSVTSGDGQSDLTELPQQRQDWGWGVVVNFQRKNTSNRNNNNNPSNYNVNSKEDSDQYLVDVLLSAVVEDNGKKLRPPAGNESGYVPFSIRCMRLVPHYVLIRSNGNCSCGA